MESSPDRNPQNCHDEADEPDFLSSRFGLQPQITWNAEGKNGENRQRHGRNAQEEQKPRRRTWLHASGHTDGRARTESRCHRQRQMKHEKRGAAETEQPPSVRKTQAGFLRESSLRFLRIFSSNCSSRLRSCWPTASTSDDSSSSREGCEPASNPATKSPAR